MTFMKTKALLFAVSVVALFVSSAFSQVDRAGLTGTVTDISGRVLPQTHVIAVQDATGLKRETISFSTGTYDIPELPVGLYTITFTHDGFKPLSFEHVVEAINQTRTLNARLQVAGGQEQVEVSASSVQMDGTSNTTGTRIEQEQIKELPLNGRNWATLTTLAPGAVDTGGSNQRSVRFAGRGRDDNNFTYDGIDATNIINQAQQPYVRLAIPLDTIQEFRVDSLLATAEAGGTGGGQMIVTSPSGTDQLHGHVFEFFRNNVFDAEQPVPVTTAPQPPFRLNQFGGTLGGPIAHDKTFFFLAYEGYRQRWGFPLTGYVPSSAFRARVLEASPELGQIVNAYPLGTAPTSDPNIDQFTSEGTQVVNENSAMIRLDQRFSEKTTE